MAFGNQSRCVGIGNNIAKEKRKVEIRMAFGNLFKLPRRRASLSRQCRQVLPRGPCNGSYDVLVYVSCWWYGESVTDPRRYA